MIEKIHETRDHLRRPLARLSRALPGLNGRRKRPLPVSAHPFLLLLNSYDTRQFVPFREALNRTLSIVAFFLLPALILLVRSK